MPHFFVSSKDIKGNEVLITGNEAKHIITVLRKREGDKIDIFDGQGNEFRVRILEVDRSAGLPRVKAEIITQKRRETEPKLKITLFQSIPKGNRLDFVIQKSTEIGISEIVPITTERTIVRLDCKRIKQRVLRWQKIAREAAKQSRRSAIPKVCPVLDFSQALKEFSAKKPWMGIIAWEMEEKNHLRKVLRSNVGGGISRLPLAIFIGPEGGFTPEEVEEARRAGVVPVSLGSRILRSETAGLVVAIVALYESRDLG
ncbi:Ribosomal RNA small subunit methyltransferase E [subsurface metagenome]